MEKIARIQWNIINLRMILQSELGDTFSQCNWIFSSTCRKRREHSVFLELIFEFMRKHSIIWRTGENMFFSSSEWLWIDCNAFINSKNPFLGVLLENVKERNLILIELYPDRFKKEWTETHSIASGNGSERFLYT